MFWLNVIPVLIPDVDGDIPGEDGPMSMYVLRDQSPSWNAISNSYEWELSIIRHVDDHLNPASRSRINIKVDDTTFSTLTDRESNPRKTMVMVDPDDLANLIEARDYIQSWIDAHSDQSSEDGEGDECQ